MPAPVDLRHARLVVERQLASQEQVAGCLHDLAGAPAGTPLLDLLVQRLYLTAPQAQLIRVAGEIEERREQDKVLGNRVVDQGFATIGQVMECFSIIEEMSGRGVGELLRLGDLLVAKGYVSKPQLARLQQGGNTNRLQPPAAAQGAVSPAPASLSPPDPAAPVARRTASPTSRIPGAPQPPAAAGGTRRMTQFPPSQPSPAVPAAPAAPVAPPPPATPTAALPPADPPSAHGFAPPPATSPAPVAALPAAAVAPPALAPPASPRRTTVHPTPQATNTARRTPAPMAAPASAQPTRLSSTPAPAPAPAVAPLPTRAPTPAPAPAPRVPAAAHAPAPSAPAAPPPATDPEPVASHLRCFFCGMEFRKGAAIRLCATCRDPYHDDCWRKAQGCIKADCRAQVGERPIRGPRLRGSQLLAQFTSPGPWLTRLGILVGLGLLGYFLYEGYFDANYYYERGKSLAAGPKAQDRVWRAVDIRRGMMAADAGSQNVDVEKTIRLQDQVACFRTAVGKKPNFVDALLDLGLALMELGKDREACEALNRVVELEPGRAEPMLVMGTVMERLRDFAAAEAWYRKALSAKPELLAAREALADLYDRLMPDRKTQAAAEYRLLLAQRPEDEEAACRLARVLIELAQVSEATLVIDRAEGFHPDSAKLKPIRAELAFALGKWEKALSFADPVAAANPSAWDMKRIQALALHHLGRDPEAFVVVKDLVGSVRDAEALVLAGRLCLQYGQADLGIGYLKQAFEVARKPALLAALGDTYLVLGRAEDARQAYEQLRSLSSGYPKVNFKLLLAAAAMKDQPAGAALVQDLLGRFPKDADMRAVDARLQREGGDPAGCLERLETLVTQEATCSYAWLQLGISRRQAGDPIGALAAFRQALALGDQPEAHFELGMTYHALHNVEAARAMFGRYVVAVPLGPNAERARTLLDKGTAPAEKDRFSASLEAWRDFLPKLGAGAAGTGDALPHIAAAFFAASDFLGVLADSPDCGPPGAGLKEAEGAFHAPVDDSAGGVPEAPEKTAARRLSASIDSWGGALTRCTQALVFAIRRRDPQGRQAAELARILDEMRSNTEFGSPAEARAAACARALASGLELWVPLLADDAPTRERLVRLQVERKLQREQCTNAVQTLCGEVYGVVKLLDVVVGIQDRRRVHADERRLLARRLDERDAQAPDVLEQLRSGGFALARLLYLLASDPGLRP
ncbi:MAG: tetratricopeptide repeat protein [Planctomycetes bacterium]|nr:tetratricopeptide repeat protein [Planctomycetota bacterium]